MKYMVLTLGNFLKVALWRTIQDLGTSDTILKSAITGMAFSLITTPLNDSFCCVSPSPELAGSFQHPLQLSKQGVIMAHNKFFHLSTSPTVSASLDLVVILLDEISSCHNDIQPQQCTFFCRTYPTPPLSVTETTLSLSFYP
jgi:dipeptide/tripeptide permease